MDGLRLALIVAGIALVAAVYFWTARRRRLDREAGDFDRFDAWIDDRLDPLADAPMHQTGDTSGEERNGEPTLDADAGIGLGSGGPSNGGSTAVGEPAERDLSRQPPGLNDSKQRLGLDAVADSLDARVEPAIGAVERIVGETASAGQQMADNAPPIRVPHPAGGAGRDGDTAKAAHDSPMPPSTASGAGRDAPRASAPGRKQDPPRSPPGSRTREPPTLPLEPELVIVLNVMAPIGQTFDGPRLRTALENAGLRAGDLQLYHYLAEGQPPAAQPIFSALNIVKPGTLAPEAFDGLRTPGVALVLRLPGPERPREAFELMHGTAMGIAEELGGRLCDDSRSTLTGQALNHLRERIAELARRQRVGG